MIRGESKVTRAHLERAAIVYVRQSTLVQVREHTESTLRQYDLAGQAARLGWAAADIEVIDADLGLSGRSASHREGFKQLVAKVCLGEVGAVFGLEVSRVRPHTVTYCAWRSTRYGGKSQSTGIPPEPCPNELYGAP